MKQPSKLLGEVRERIRSRHYSIRIEEAYVDWAKRFILFHNKRRPKDVGVTSPPDLLQEIPKFIKNGLQSPKLIRNRF